MDTGAKINSTMDRGTYSGCGFWLFFFYLLLFGILIALLSCGENDPGPKFDCEQLQQDVERAHDRYDAVNASNPYLVVSTPSAAAVKAWQEKMNVAEEVWVTAVKEYNTKCK